MEPVIVIFSVIGLLGIYCILHGFYKAYKLSRKLNCTVINIGVGFYREILDENTADSITKEEFHKKMENWPDDN